MKIILRNEAGMVKEVKKGFSWTVFFFGVFVPLIRGDLKWAGIMLLISILAGVVTMGFGAFIPGVIFAFKYNKVYMKDLYEKGYRVANDGEEEMVLNYINS